MRLAPLLLLLVLSCATPKAHALTVSSEVIEDTCGDAGEGIAEWVADKAHAAWRAGDGNAVAFASDSSIEDEGCTFHIGVHVLLQADGRGFVGRGEMYALSECSNTQCMAAFALAGQ